MKRKTYNNMCKAAKMIMAKGYDKKTAFELAHSCFEKFEANKNGMPVEWYIDKILTKSEYDSTYNARAING